MSSDDRDNLSAGTRRLWTLAEVVRLTGYSESTIKRALSAGEILPHRPGARRIVHSELCRWLGYDPLTELDRALDRADENAGSPNQPPGERMNRTEPD
jgi:predicted DNA-binding transcriptional regulator AlpA